MTRKWLRPLDLAVLALLLLLSLLAFLLVRTGGEARRAEVYLESTLLYSVSLASLTEPTSYTVETERGALTVLFEADGVSVLATDCPDAVCVRTGKVDGAGESIVCAPLGVSVVLSGEGTLDGVTG